MFKPFWILWSLCFSLSVPACSTTPPTTDTPAAYVLQIQVDDATFSATLLDTPATEALLDLLPLTLNMQELNGNEKYATLPQALPTDAAQPGQIDHVPQAHGQMVTMPAMDGHAFKTVAVMRTGLLAGAMVAALPHLPQKLHLHLIGFFLFALLVQFILPNCQFISINFHMVHLLFVLPRAL